MNKCLIIDDELPARELIQAYLEVLPDFEVMNSIDNAIEGFVYLQNHQVDLLFLDIQMPRMTGLELLKSLQIRPKVVLTTAFREFAADGFDLDVLDYLVKPISQERFLKTISKYLYFKEITQDVSSQKLKVDDAYIFLKADKEQKKVFLHEILYIEGLKDYIKVYTLQGMYVVYERLGFMEAKLPESKFVRVHKSFIISLGKVSKYTNEVLNIDQYEIPLGRMYKQNFLSKVGLKE